MFLLDRLFKDNKTKEIDVELLDETEKSIKVKYGVSTTYLPKKLISFDRLNEGRITKVRLPLQLYRKKVWVKNSEMSIDLKKIKHPFQPDWVRTDKDVGVFLELLDKTKPDDVDEKDWYPPFIYGVKINDKGEEQLYSIFSKWYGDYDPVQVGKPSPNIIPLKMTD